MKIILSFLITFIPFVSFAGNCDYSWQRDSAGRRCGGRAAAVIPGGRLGGDGKYKDSYGRSRLYGPSNDRYDNNTYNNSYKAINNSSFNNSFYSN